MDVNILAFLCLFAMLTHYTKGQGLLAYSVCEDETNNGTLFYACVSQSLHLLEGSNSNFQISVEPESATCGEPSEDVFAYNSACTHSSLGPVRECDVCDNTQPALSHPIEHIVDGTDMTYWLSRTWLDYSPSDPFFRVNITIKFNHAYELRDDVSITFESSRPKSMVLYKSMDDGVTWQPLQYYYMECADSDADPSVGITRETPDAVVCTEDYSDELPYSNGEVIFPVSSDRYGLFLGTGFSDFESLYQAFNNTNLDEFLTFTDIRISLLYPMTDGKETLRQPLDLIKYYYGISKISLLASCHCNLHGRFCTFVNDSTTCDCRHFTAGRSCERCLPLYNNRTWNPGSYLPYPTGTANECQRCECNGHAVSCTYSQAEGHGICDNCTDNTQGFFCEQCLDGYYINSSVPLSHPDVCIDCDCETLGLINENDTCDSVTGQCPCKELIATNNRRCDRCSPGYYGLLLADNQPGVCKDCACNSLGTHPGTSCDVNSGDCACKETITGRACDQCRDGFYSFPDSPEARCLSCSCNPGGSVSASCDQETGQCQCRVNVTGLRCDGVQPGFYVPHIDVVTLQPASGGTCVFETDVISEANPFTGDFYATCIESQSVVFAEIAGGLYQPDVVERYVPVVRYSRNASLSSWSGMELEVEVTGNSGADISGYQDSLGMGLACPQNGVVNTFTLVNITSEMGGAYSVGEGVDLDMRCRYQLTLRDTSADTDVDRILIDSLVLLPDVASSAIYLQADEATRLSYEGCVSNVSRLRSREATLGTETCRDFFFAVMTELTGRALPCQCDPVGSLPEVCNAHGGQCACKTGVYGLTCDHCEPGYFNLTAGGCEACECTALGSENPVCEQESGQCDCLDSVAQSGDVNADGNEADRTCSSCLQNYYGFVTGQGCRPCGCSTDGRLSSQCNAVSGQCECKQTIGGLQCDQCLPGYFRFTADGCSECNCTEEGATSIACHQETGACTCKANVVGDRCDACSETSFNLNAENPDGCQPCFCYGHGTQCVSAEGYQTLTVTANLDETRAWTQMSTFENAGLTHIRAPERFLGNQLHAYMQSLSVGYQARTRDVNVTGHMLVIIEGNDTWLYFSTDDFSIPVQQPASLDILLHESLWKRADTDLPIGYFNFYAVLADMTGLFIQRNFVGEVVNVMSVTWPGANRSLDGSSDVTSVERCGCSPERNAQGTSCESCSTGYQRMGLPGDAYDVCQSCDCNNNGETEPPVCDENTGQCLNCRNGTVGFNCESCAPNVRAPGCTECEDEFWGLSRDGCQPCNCHDVGSTSAVCDRATGQCTCKTNVEGQQCDRCVDNHFNLRASGCEGCDECYGLVGEQVDIVRGMRTDLAERLAGLQANDSTVTLGNFTERKQRTIENMQQLTEFLERARQVQGPVTETVSRLNTSLTALRALLSNEVRTLLDAANQTTEETGRTVDEARDVMSVTNITVREAYALITDDVMPTTTELQQLVEDMQEIEQTISTASNDSLGQAMALSVMVQEIEQNSTEANALAASSFQTVQQNLATHANTNNKIAEVTAFFNLVNTQGSDRVTEVDTLTNVTSGIVADVNSSRTAIEQLQLFDNEQLDELERQIENLSDRAQTSIDEATAESTTRVDPIDIPDVQSRTAAMVTQTEQTKSVVDDFLARMTDAHSTVVEAAALVNRTFIESETMLAVTSDFDNRARAVEQRANDSLSSVESLIRMSQDALSASRLVSDELGPCIAQSSTARLSAQQASATAQRNLQSISPLPSRGSTLRSRCDDQLVDLEARASSIVLNNMTKLSPAHDVCTANKNQMDDIERLSLETRNNMTAVSMEINSTRDSVRDIITAAQGVTQIDTSDVTRLRQIIEETRQDFNSRSLASRVTQLKADIEEKQRWLDDMRTRKSQLQLQLNRLRSIHDQLQP